MKLLIRADANNFIATGHVMRCISIARAAIKKGHEVKFVVADLDSELLLKKYGMTYICLHTTWNNMDGEIDKVSGVISGEKPDCVLVDSYYVTEKYLSALRLLCKVAYIDDLDMFVYPCDILICYANYYKKFHYEEKYPSTTQLLLGGDYAPLREEYSGINGKTINKEVKDVLILSGGTDRFSFIKNFLRTIVDRPVWGDIHLTVICGMYNEDYNGLVDKYNKSNNISIFKAVDNIHEYMQRTDVCVSAAGTTLYELCASGTPTVCYTLADNQLDNAVSFDETRTVIYAGDIREDNALEKIVNETEKIIHDYDERCQMSEKMRKLIDGNGAKKIVDKIQESVERGKEK